MSVVRLKGLNKATKRLSSGKTETYWYAWRGGPRLEGKPGSPEFTASYLAAMKGRKTPSADNFSTLIARYKASPEFLGLRASTKREWMRWLDRIIVGLGSLPVSALNDPDVRADILQWRDKHWGDQPRSADYAIQVLSRVLSWAHGRALLKINAAEGIAHLWKSDRADVIWSEDEIACYIMVSPSPEVGFILPLACLTGLRREDLALLEWSDVGDFAIVITAGKSRTGKEAVVPLIPETRALLKEIRAHQLARGFVRADRVLTTTRGMPWSPSGVSHALIDVKLTLGIDKHLHDARGTFATRLRMAGLTAPQIADVLGWDGDRVERLLARYVDRNRIVRALAERLAQNETGT